MTQFTDLGLAAPIMKALAGENYTTPTPIQAKAIPIVLAGSDLLGIAQTGTGKTAAFALPILHRLAAGQRRPARKGCRVLVLSPTRELASQIAESFTVYGRHLGVSVAKVFGGVAARPQIRTMNNGVDVLVATPGRLLDHMSQGHIMLHQTEVFVLDEADQMLDLGFVKPIRMIASKLPAKRQTLLFSATMPKEIRNLANAFLTDPVTVAVTPVASTVSLITQSVIHVERCDKLNTLANLLRDPAMARTLVFTRTKRGADRVARTLANRSINAAAIHGNKSQNQRERALEAFRRGKTRVLVATDIAARGIDIDDVSHVVNFEMPEVPEAYVHRIGRTARAGASGRAISLCDGTERKLLRAIERLTGQKVPLSEFAATKPAPGEKSATEQPATPPRGAGASRGQRPDPGAREDARPARRRRKPKRTAAASNKTRRTPTTANGSATVKPHQPRKPARTASTASTAASTSAASANPRANTKRKENSGKSLANLSFLSGNKPRTKRRATR